MIIPELLKYLMLAVTALSCYRDLIFHFSPPYLFCQFSIKAHHSQKVLNLSNADFHVLLNN